MIHSFIDAARGFLGGDGTLILPELELILFACGILLLDRWLAEHEKHWNAVLGLAGTGFSAFTLYVQHGKIQALREANSELPGLLGVHQSMLADPFFLFFATLFLIATALVILLSVRHLQASAQPPGGYYALLLFACTGMMLMISAVDLVVTLIGLEAMGLSCYLLARRSRLTQSPDVAGEKFAMLWATSSIVLGAGFLLLYELFRTTNLGRMGAILEVRIDNGVPFGGLTNWIPTLALALIAIGAFLWMDIVPFHWFAPGIGESASTPVAAYLNTAGEIAGFALLLRFFSFLFLFAHEKWIHIWGAAAIVSLLWGTIAACLAKNVKRLLVYGAVAQTGFILLGLVAGNDLGFSAMLYYMGAYIFMAAGAFGILLVLEQNGAAASKLEDIDGLLRRSPTAASLFVVCLMALAGVPPTAGFAARYYIVKGLFSAPHPELAVFAILSAIAGLFYYGRVAAHVLKKLPLDASPQAAPPLTIGSAQTIALTVAVFVSVVAGLYPEPFLRIARYAFGL